MARYVEAALPQPAAGTDISWTPATGCRFRLIALTAQLVTSATVANRTPVLELEDTSGNVTAAKAVVSAQTAGTTVLYSWTSGSAPAEAGSTVEDGVVSDGVFDWWLPAGSKIITATTNLKSGDQWSAIFGTALVDDDQEWQRAGWKLAGMLGLVPTVG